MIVASRRLLLFVAVFAATAACAPALFSQASRLPDAPGPQLNSSETLIAENFSSSGPSTQATTPQTAQPQTAQPAPPLTDAEKKQAAEDESKRELHQRIGGVVPNFNAVLDGSNVPLRPGQKMHAAFRSAIDPYQVGLALFSAGIGQAEDSHDTFTPQGVRVGYGQGWEGYGKRFGAGFTDQFDGTMIGNGILPVLLHQDARYFRLGTGSFTHRLLYSMSTTVRCKGDNGKWQPNYSNVLGNIAAGGISNLYYPAADRGFALTIEQGIIVSVEGTFGAFLIEFYPDIKKHFQKQ